MFMDLSERFIFILEIKKGLKIIVITTSSN